MPFQLKINKHAHEHADFAWIMFARFMVNTMLAMMGMVAQAVASRTPIHTIIAVLVLVLVGLFTIGQMFVDMRPKTIPPKVD
jgi:putative Mn2+ efflux pump MntP